MELLVTDRDKRRWDEALGVENPFGAAMHAATPWRAAEARLLAKRVHELHEQAGWEWRDIVLLFRATTHMSFYERALDERGIPTHVVGGRGYWAQQQVADLRHWLAALANPLDELAVYSVLASPLAGWESCSRPRTRAARRLSSSCSRGSAGWRRRWRSRR